jgi:HK97 family phage major capsid protein
MLLAEDALAERMVNRVATLEQTVERAFRKTGGSRRVTAAIEQGDEPFWPAAANPAFVQGGVAMTASGGSEWGDRRTEPVVTSTRERNMEPETQDEVREEPIAPQPRADDPARGEMFQAVHELREAVAELHAGRADQEKVDRLSEEMMELRAQLDAATQARSGYLPGDELADARMPLGMDTLAVSFEASVPAAAAMLHRPEPDVADFREKSDNLLLLAAAMKADPRSLKYYEQEFLPSLAAMDTQTTAEGKEWVPTVMSSDLIRRIELALKVPALFRSLEMPSNPYDMPGVGVARVRGGKAVEQTADTGQTGFKKITPATRKVTLTAVKFAAEVLVSKEEEEDSLIPVIPFLRDEIVTTLAFDVEDCTINGDVAGSHQDTDVVAADDPRKNWDGLRKLVQAATKTDGSAAVIDSTKLRVNRKKMAKYGVDSSQIVHIMSIAGYINLLGDTNVLTVDKYGPNAVIKVGELASVDGIPVVVSQFVRDDLNATGVYDGTTTTKTAALTVNTNCFVYGNRRALTLQMLRELYAEYDQDALAVSLRKAFAPIYPLATEKTVALTYNTNN